MGAAALGTVICDFQGDNFDHTGLGFIGGALLVQIAMGHGVLTYQPTPPGTPGWGSQWKQAVAHYYNRTIQVLGLHDHLSYRGNYLSLDPANTTTFLGDPLLRLTYDYGPNEHKMSEYLVGVGEKISKAMGPSKHAVYGLPKHFDGGAGYGIVHQVGGAITGDNPGNSVVNKYMQSWELPNLFVVGASAFPQISSFNPTGTVGALAYFAADAIKTQYLKKPGPRLLAVRRPRSVGHDPVAHARRPGRRGACPRFVEIAETEFFRSVALPYATVWDQLDIWLPRVQKCFDYRSPAPPDESPTPTRSRGERPCST